METMHKGQSVRYDENKDVWRCYGLDLEHERLGLLKAAIDRCLLAMRKKNSLACIAIPSNSHGDFSDAKIIEWVGPTSRRSWTRDHVKEPVIEVQIMVDDRGSGKFSRRKSSIDLLAPIGPETDKAIARIKEARQECRAAERKLRDAFAQVPTITVEDIKGLFDVANGVS